MATAALAEVPEQPNWKDVEALETYRTALYRNYRACDGILEDQLPSASLARACTQFYLLLKLSFLSDVSLERYQRMGAEARAKTNRRGYDAYFAWKKARIAGVI